ncbi:MAG: succinylglutamate desuccinylase/aspartoacylase family protein [Thermoplasmata archaeon]|jgi:predicted deacylase
MTKRKLASVLGVSGERGTKSAGYLPVAEHPDGSPEKLPFILVNGAEDGPCLWLTACEHGDEVLAAASVVEFVAGLDPKEVRGQVAAFPVLASTAFNIRHRFSPIDSYDFSRAWPGFKNGWLSEQVASRLFDTMGEHANYVINVHDGMPGQSDLTPYVIATHETASEWESGLKDFTESFLIDKVIHWAGTSTTRGARTSTMMAALMNKRIPSFVPEIGPDTKNGLTVGVRGFGNAMKHLGMLQGKPEKLPKYQSFADVIHIFPTRGGVFNSHVGLNDVVWEGQKLASIRNFSGQITETLVSPAAGVVIAIWVLPMIGSGDFAAYEIATFKEFNRDWPGER